MDHPDPLPLAKSLESSDLEPAKVKRKRVLLVDDHKAIRDGLKRLMQGQANIEVVGEAADGREALELARLLRPDVIIMDISMPVMNGIDATRRIKAEISGIRVIGLSMFEDEQAGSTMRNAGADGYVIKTAPPAELLKAIHGLTREEKQALTSTSGAKRLVHPVLAIKMAL
jgi:DNA-binding NarL/FixJ family response regulator